LATATSLDVARMLVLPEAELAATDTPDHAIAALANSAIREAIVLGRRGPAQAAFTHPKLRVKLTALGQMLSVARQDDVEATELSDRS
jgi:ferredoxin/flavodoxin---NADP+ reductase